MCEFKVKNMYVIIYAEWIASTETCASMCLAGCALLGHKQYADAKANQRVDMAEVTLLHFQGNENLWTNLNMCDLSVSILRLLVPMYPNACVCVYMYVCVYEYMSVFVSVHACVCVCVCVCACASLHTHTYTSSPVLTPHDEISPGSHVSNQLR